MYDYLHGDIMFKNGDSFTLETGGVGYHISFASQTLQDWVRESTVGQETTQDRGNDKREGCRVYVYHQQSETINALFGFLSRAERDVFRLLISVSGIGPKLAARIMLADDCGALCRKIESGNISQLGQIKGLGVKTAEKLILELRKKIIPLAVEFGAVETLVDQKQIKVEKHPVYEETLLALKGLGYKEAEALPLLAKIFESQDPPQSLEKAITLALRGMQN